MSNEKLRRETSGFDIAFKVNKETYGVKKYPITVTFTVPATNL